MKPSSQPSGSSDIRGQLEALYVPLFQTVLGMTFAQANSTFCRLYRSAEREAKKDGTIRLPVNRGDILLEKESLLTQVESMLAKRRAEGVQDEDIRWWMNRHELDRRMMIRADDLGRRALLTKLCDRDGLSTKEAARAVKRYYPIFGDPHDTRASRGDDRPLPFELKNRIEVYFHNRVQTDPAQYKKEILESSSFNALIRKEIKAGKV